MRIDPQIARLRADPAPGIADAEAADAAVEQWQALPETQALLADLGRHGAGVPLAQCPVLEALVTGGEAALARAMLGRLCDTLSRHPLGQPRLACSRSAASTRLVLASAGRSSLSLVLNEPVPASPSPSAVFADGEVHMLALAGRAQATFVLRDGARLVATTRPLQAGDACALDLERETLNLAPEGSAFVSLRLNRLAARPGVAQQVDLASGAVLHQSAADPSESRTELAMALLRAMGRADAAPAIAQVAGAGSAPLRWQALRECLALDAATGFAALLAAAGTEGDPLAPPARALAASLAARHPVLARMMENAPCPA